jgi:hypothetical protein
MRNLSRGFLNFFVGVAFEGILGFGASKVWGGTNFAGGFLITSSLRFGGGVA